MWQGLEPSLYNGRHRRIPWVMVDVEYIQCQIFIMEGYLAGLRCIMGTGNFRSRFFCQDFSASLFQALESAFFFTMIGLGSPARGRWTYFGIFGCQNIQAEMSWLKNHWRGIFPPSWSCWENWLYCVSFIYESNTEKLFAATDTYLGSSIKLFVIFCYGIRCTHLGTFCHNLNLPR